MVPAEEQIAMRMKMFEKLKTNFPWLARQEKNFHFRRPVKSNPSNIKDDQKATEAALNTPRSFFSPGEDQIPSLQELIETNQDDESSRIYLGVCDDGLPLTLDLDNPAPGAILITGEAKSGKTRLLRAILSSAAYTNAADELLIFICTDHRDEYSDILELDHCQEVMDHTDRRLPYLIKELVDEIENRRLTGPKPTIILAIERIDRLLQSGNKAMFEQILRLLKHGARNGIWILASLSSNGFSRLDPLLLDAFRTHLIGYIADFEAIAVLAYDPSCPAQQLRKGDQFCAWISGDWLNFSICDPERARPLSPEMV